MKLKKPEWKIPTGLFETVYNLPGWQKAAIFAGSWAIPIAIFWFLFLSPKLTEIQNISQQLPALRQQIQNLEKKSRQIPQLEAELKTVDTIFSKAMKLLPETKDIPSVLTEISSLGNEERLMFLSFKPGREQLRNFYAEIPVKLQFTGPFHNTVSFFDKVSRMARIVHIKEVSMGSARKNKEVWSKKGTLEKASGNIQQNSETKVTDSGETSIERGGDWIITTTCNAVTYRFLTPEEQKAQKKQGKKKR